MCVLYNLKHALPSLPFLGDALGYTGHKGRGVALGVAFHNLLPMLTEEDTELC